MGLLLLVKINTFKKRRNLPVLEKTSENRKQDRDPFLIFQCSISAAYILLTQKKLFWARFV